MPVGGALDAVPVDLAFLVDIGQPRYFLVVGMTVFDQRVLQRRAKAPPERGKLRGAKPLVAEHQHRMLGEGLLDPGEGRVVEPRQIHPQRLGAERLAQRAQLR